MNEPQLKNSNLTEDPENLSQRGSALVIALFVLALISVFVALALSRTAAEATAVGNETAEGRALYAAQGSLEMMTRNFNKIFEVKINPSSADLDAVRDAGVPGLSAPAGQYTFVQERPLQTTSSAAVVLPGGPYAGLYAIRDNWRLRTTATDPLGVQVQLTRNILNNRIPIFQFGIFYDDDLELFRPPRFSFGGRVHSNGNFFVSPGAEGVYFDSRVTATGQIITQTWRNWNQSDSANNQTFIKNASGVFKQLLPDRGSVLNTTAGAADNIFEFPPSNPVPTPTPNLDLPPSRINPSWATQSAIFDGNLKAQAPRLKLPLSVGANTDLIEMLRRGKEIPTAAGGDLLSNAGTLEAVTTATVDNSVLRSERFANKTGIRVSLADSKAKLPGCASGIGTAAVTTACGVRLDGNMAGAILSSDPQDPLTVPAATAAGNLGLASRGYQPRSMKRWTADAGYGYTPTRVNGERLYTGREVWIKIETVQTDAATGAIQTSDITQDILALGVTEQAPDLRSDFQIDSASYDSGNRADNRTDAPSRDILQTAAQTSPSTGTDSRSVIKLQRFLIPGPQIPTGGGNYTTSFTVSGDEAYTGVVRYTNADAARIALGCPTPPAPGPNCSDSDNGGGSTNERYGHLKRARVGGGGFDDAVVPFPIEMFDAREGEYYDERSKTYYADTYYDNYRKISQNGVMSMIDIDVANLRRFLRGDFNGLFPTDTPFAIGNGSVGLRSTDIPQKEGWVLYVSDRRGDRDFDGEFDMEDVYGAAPGNDGIMQRGEDLQLFPGTFGLGVLNTDYGNETERYRDNTTYPDQAAVFDHKYYRRGVRLINGTTVPGVYDSATPANTRGFTLATENGVYVYGNFNATGVASVPSTGNTPYDQYLPFNTATHIPASIVADAVTILSNSKFFPSGSALPDYDNGWNDGKSFSSLYSWSDRVATTTQMRFAMISGDTIASKEATPNQGGISPKLNGGVHNFKRFLEDWNGRRLDYSGSLINLFNSRNNNGTFKCCNTIYRPPTRNWVFDSTFLDPTRLPPGTPFFQYVQTTGFERTNS